ncbi:MAG: aspartate kinase [Candidatus Dormibacteria bacterium]
MSVATSAGVRVLKFGGSSLADARRISAVATIVRRERAASPLVLVVSALEGVTAALLRAATAASRREGAVWEGVGEELRRRHLEALEALLPEPERPLVQDQLERALRDFHELCSGFALVRELPPRSLDSLASLGELVAAALVAAHLRSQGLSAEALDAAELIVSDDRHGHASALPELTRTRVRGRLLPLLEQGAIPVVTGFRAATRDGSCTTLGRGGSDYSATILGATLAADAVWIFTDVPGMMTADPELVGSAHVISRLSYQEAMELAFFGAKVLHARSLDLPERSRIPVFVKNTFDPQAHGTEIGPGGGGRSGVRALAATGEAVLFTVTGAPGVGFPRLASLIFGGLDALEVSTLLVTQSSAENVLTFAVPSTEAAEVRRRLERERGRVLAEVEVLERMGVVVAVGDGMRGTPGIAARIFGALASHGINVRAIAQGSGELSISWVLRSEDVGPAVRAVHREFGL